MLDVVQLPDRLVDHSLLVMASLGDAASALAVLDLTSSGIRSPGSTRRNLLVLLEVKPWSSRILL